VSNSGKSASEHQALPRSTPPPKKRRNVHNADSQVADCDSRFKQSATKQPPPRTRRRLFHGDDGQSDAEVPCKREAEQTHVVNFKPDCRPKARCNPDASTHQARYSLSSDTAAFAGAHAKSKPRRSVAAPMDDYSCSSDELAEETQEGFSLSGIIFDYKQVEFVFRCLINSN
jgi:hypothetical protein